MAQDSDRRYWIEPGELLPCNPLPEVEPPPWPAQTRQVGQEGPRLDAYERVSGTALYTFDVQLPDMLHAAVLRCPHPHARVVEIDASEAERMPGVRAVLHHGRPGADIPWYARTGTPQSQLFDPLCRYAGEEVAAVAADSELQARDALRAVRVRYELLPWVIDPLQALEEGAPPVHPGGNLEEDVIRRGRGDVEQGFAAADVVVEESFTVGTQLHVPMESFGSVARWEGQHLTVWDSTQGVYSVASTLSQALGLPFSRVRVLCPYVGGGFGAKLRTGKYTVIAALLARRTGRPVRLFLSREETMTCVGNRPGARMRMRAGAKRDGTLTALRLDVWASGGAYGGNRYTVGAQVLDLYRCPNVLNEERWAYTNTGPARAMRAPGFPQCSFALEQAMDQLAAELELDPVELRLRNGVDYSQFDEASRPYTSSGLASCLRDGAEAFGWEAARRRAGTAQGHWVRGAGVAACNWWAGDGGPPSTATARVFVDGSVTIYTGASDLGTGTRTVAAWVAAEELGLDPEHIQVVNADTSTAPYHYSSGGSNTVPGAIPAVRQAVFELKCQLLSLASETLQAPPDELDLRDNVAFVAADPQRRATVEELLRSRQLLDVVATGYRGPNPEDKIVRPFGAQFAEVEVHRLTGEVRVLRLLGAHDSGRVLQRTTYDNQVHGGMVQGLGFGMTEHRVMDAATGTVASTSWHDYKIPTVLDVPPELESRPVDPGDRECNNLGAKGLGEPPVIPTAAAVANAVYAAVGVRPTETPMAVPTLVSRLAAAAAAKDGEAHPARAGEDGREVQP